MRQDSQEVIIFCFGEGGHNAQANRLAKLLVPLLEGHEIVTLSDVKERPDWSDRHYVVEELRSKHSHIETFKNRTFMRTLRIISQVAKKEDVKALISTGPGISLIASIYFKWKGAKIIHIETWSRIKTSSLTGRFMYRVADKFYVQHKSLLDKYPEGIYAGIL